MAKLESKFQKELMDEIKNRYPECIVVKNDSGYIQGFPDWTIFYKDKWIAVEAKRSKDAPKQPNQEYYINKLNEMSCAMFAYPENKEDVLNAIQQTFEP